MKSRAVRIDREQLNELADVKFDYCNIVELAHLAAIYVSRFSDSLPDWLIIRTLRNRRPSPRTTERDTRRAFVDAVEWTWRERRRRNGLGSYYRPLDEVHDGPLIRLIQYLLHAAGEWSPSNATLHHDLVALRTGRERAGHRTPTKRAAR